MMGGVAPNGVINENALIYYRASNGLNKPNAYNSSIVTFNRAVTEINNYRPFMLDNASPDEEIVIEGL